MLAQEEGTLHQVELAQPDGADGGEAPAPDAVRALEAASSGRAWAGAERRVGEDSRKRPRLDGGDDGGGGGAGDGAGPEAGALPASAPVSAPAFAPTLRRGRRRYLLALPPADGDSIACTLPGISNPPHPPLPRTPSVDATCTLLGLPCVISLALHPCHDPHSAITLPPALVCWYPTLAVASTCPGAQHLTSFLRSFLNFKDLCFTVFRCVCVCVCVCVC